jgi:hypothetical protein
MMKILNVAILAILLVSLCAFGQATSSGDTALQGSALTSNFAAAGISYAPGATPAIAGTGLYARLVSSSSSTYSFTVMDAVPTSTRPFSVSTQTATGVAQKLLTATLFKKHIDVFATGAAGPSWTGSNTGWAWNAGGLASIPVGKNYILPNVRVEKSSVNNHSDYQILGGLLYGWGWN